MRRKTLGAVATLGLALAVSACNSTNSSNGVPTQESTVAASSAPVPPPPRYDQVEDGTYYYISDVSEEEKKRGKAVGSVIGFRYLGKNEKGEHVLLNVANAGTPLGKSVCADPCRIIKQGNERVGFSTDSIIGAAFEDAIAGNLKVYGKKSSVTSGESQIVNSVPKTFRGAWDELVSDGCRDREPRFEIDATKFYNFEVEYDVTSVKIYSPTEIAIRTTYKDENGSQESGVWEFRLVEGGKALTGRKSNETYFRKCPAA